MSEPLSDSPAHACVRMCVGCRERSGRHELLRVVVVPASDGAPGCLVAEPDVHARRPGRGAWIHPRIGCFDLAERRRAWVRAFRLVSPPDTSPVRNHLEAQHDARVDADEHGPERALDGAGAVGLPEKAGREAMSAR